MTLSVEVSDPPALDATRTTAGGAVTAGNVAVPLTSGPNPGTVRTGASAPDSVSLEVAVTVRSFVSASYVADPMVTRSVSAAVFGAGGLSPALTTVIFVPAGTFRATSMRA